ncbi:hypothetical protein GB937_010274 [Aspergillus fischeri]|nr:hypothetical protein GB937_010274 [Aspergillus fischeri]
MTNQITSAASKPSGVAAGYLFLTHPDMALKLVQSTANGRNLWNVLNSPKDLTFSLYPDPVKAC